MKASKKAQELVDKFKDYVHGYVGSSMLTNYEYPDQILSQAKKAALIAVEEAEKSEYNVLVKFNIVIQNYKSDYWQQVKNEIERLKD